MKHTETEMLVDVEDDPDAEQTDAMPAPGVVPSHAGAVTPSVSFLRNPARSSAAIHQRRLVATTTTTMSRDRKVLVEIEESESNAVSCPQYRVHGLISNQLLAWRWSVHAIWVVCSLGTAASLLAVHNSPPQADDHLVSNFLWKVMLMNVLIAIVLMASFLPGLRRGSTPGGPLEQLGATTAKVSAEAKRGLDQWHRFMAYGLAFPFVCIGILVAMAPLLDRNRLLVRDAFNPTLEWTVTSIWMNTQLATVWFVMALAALWNSSLFVAATLADDAVVEVIQSIRRLQPTDAEWGVQVEQAVLGLADDTMPLLEDGWGSGVLGWWVTMWLAAFGCCIIALISPDPLGAAGFLLCSFGAAIAPLLLVLPLARVGTRCDDLLRALNDKGLRNLQLHSHIDALERRLRRLNSNQGLGLVIGGVVLDKRKLLKVFVYLGTLTSTLVPAVLVLKPNRDVLACGELSQAQRAALHAVVTTFSFTGDLAACSAVNVTLLIGRGGAV